MAGTRLLVLLAASFSIISSLNNCSSVVPRYPYTPCSAFSHGDQCTVRCDQYSEADAVIEYNSTCSDGTWSTVGDCSSIYASTCPERTAGRYIKCNVPRFPAGMELITTIFTLKPVNPTLPVLFTRSLFQGISNLQQLVAYDAIPGEFDADAVLDLPLLQTIGLEPTLTSQLATVPAMISPSVTELEFGVQHLNVTAVLEQYPAVTSLVIRTLGQGAARVTLPPKATQLERLILNVASCTSLLNALPSSLTDLKDLRLTCSTGLDAIDARILPSQNKIQRLIIIAPAALTIDLDALFTAVRPVYDELVPLPVSVDFALGRCNMLYEHPNELSLRCLCNGQTTRLGSVLCAPTAWLCSSSRRQMELFQVCSEDLVPRCDDGSDTAFCTATLMLVDSFPSALDACLRTINISVSHGQLTGTTGANCDLLTGSLRTGELADGNVGVSTFRMMWRPNTALIDILFIMRRLHNRPVDVTAVYRITSGALLRGKASDKLPFLYTALIPSSFMPFFRNRLTNSLQEAAATTPASFTTKATVISTRSSKPPVLAIAVTVAVVAIAVALFFVVRATRAPSSNQALALQLSQCVSTSQRDVCASHPHLATKGELPLIPRYG